MSTSKAINRKQDVYVCADCGREFNDDNERDDHFMSPACEAQGMYDEFGMKFEEEYALPLNIVRRAQMAAIESFKVYGKVHPAGMAARHWLVGAVSGKQSSEAIGMEIAADVEQKMIARIAVQFVMNLKADGIDLKKVDRVNRSPEYKRTNSCASHDQCDANMYMHPAWVSVMEREIDLQDDHDTALWNAAWAYTVKTGFAKLAQ